jgi:hypothetical protein
VSFRQEFNSLLHSDLTCAGAEGVQQLWTGWLTVSVAHFGIGMAVSAVVLLRGYSVRWLWAGMVGIVLKEVSGDLPTAAFAWPVILDSLWDLACYLGGFFVLWGLMMSEEGDAT